MGYFFYEFDPTNIESYRFEKPKITFPPNLKRLRMGNVYYMVKIIGNSTLFLIDKIMLTNFPNLNAPTAELKYICINGDRVGMEDEKILINCDFIPKSGQKKETLLLSTHLILCTTKQAVYDLMKHEISRHFYTIAHYLNEKKWTDWQERCVTEYKKAIERLKSL